MSRVIPFACRRARQALGLGASLVLLLALMAPPVSAQDRPPCSDERTHDCVLPDWSDAVQRDIPSLFGGIDGIVWVDDASGDAPPDGLDILGVGLGRVDIGAPKRIRDSKALLKLGNLRKAVRGGEGVLVRIVLDRPPDEVEGGHAGVHLATDIDGSRSNNAPSGVSDPANPFAGSGDVYSLTWASTTGKTRLLGTDLAKGWYKDKGPFAASWAAPNVLDILVKPQAFGDGFRVATHTAGAQGGFDSVSVGPNAIPADGRLTLVPACVEGSIAVQPFVVQRLVENGQTLRNVEAPASWRGGATLPIDDSTRAALEAVIAAADEDGDGRIGLASTVNLFEDGVVIRQRPQVELAIDGNLAHIAVELGLTRRGYNVLRDFELAPTGDAAVDEWLEDATEALSETMPPFRSGKKAGLVAGEGIGSCVPWLEAPPEPEPDTLASPSASPSASPDASAEPSADATAASA